MEEAINFFNKRDRFSYECVVVGSGAGGGLTADFLASRGKEVLVLEEGPDVSLEKGSCGVTSSFKKMWRNGGITPIMSNANFLFAEGRCLGGSSMVNAALINHTGEEVLSSWSKKYQVQDIEGLSFFQERIEKRLGVITFEDQENKIGQFFKKGARACGLSGFDIPVAARKEGGFWRKNNIRDIFLKRASEYGAKVITNCRVNKIILRGSKAYAVRATYAGPYGKKNFDISCDKLFISAGATQTPLFLRRSGIKKNIGNSLQFHIYLRMVADFGENLNAYNEYMPSFQIKNKDPDFSMGVSLSSPAVIASGLSFNWPQNNAAFPYISNMAIFYISSKSHSLGTIRNFPLGEASYFIRYGLNKEDLRSLSSGYAKLGEILFAAGAKNIYPALDKTGAVASFTEMEEYKNDFLPVEKMNLISVHAFSSCPMGEDKKRCAVDSWGKLYGFDNIFLNDASILPSSPGGNPQGPIMAVALRNMEKNFG